MKNENKEIDWSEVFRFVGPKNKTFTMAEKDVIKQAAIELSKKLSVPIMVTEFTFVGEPIEPYHYKESNQ